LITNSISPNFQVRKFSQQRQYSVPLRARNCLDYLDFSSVITRSKAPDKIVRSFFYNFGLIFALVFKQILILDF
jgi:hypothetical protein